VISYRKHKALVAAAVAAERDRICALADAHDVFYIDQVTPTRGVGRSFAELIRKTAP